ncbi:MAG: BamA/TamA family outer membrane protein [Cytophagales bacterium]
MNRYCFLQASPLREAFFVHMNVDICRTTVVELFIKMRLSLVFALLITPLASLAQTDISTPLSKRDSVVTPYKNKLLIFPLTARSIETNWVFGVANAFIFKTNKKDTALRVSTIPSGFIYTLNNQILLAIGANIFLPKERYIIRFENSFSKFPDKFWGIGNRTDGKKPESYTFTQFYINPQLYRKVKGNLFLGGGFDFQRVFNLEYEPGGYFDQDQVLGAYDLRDYNVFGYSLFINYDSRNHAYQPNRGVLFRVKFSDFNKALVSDYDFRVLEIDFRRFIKVFGGNILAFQSFSTFNFGNVPYRNLAILGGNNMMRGYYAGRYRDKKAVTAQVEYRFPIIGRFAGVAFASAGQVANDFDDFDWKLIKPAVGAGIRFAVLRQEKLNLRFDLAAGNSGELNYYIVLAESF